jgi:hypothetical protein
MNTMKLTTTTSRILITILTFTFMVGTASAVPKLNAVSYDPAFVSAGDKVNISANIKETEFPDKQWDEDKELKVVLKPDSKLTRDYITIIEDRDESIGFLYPNGVWNQNFKVDVSDQAPTGKYAFELQISYLDSEEDYSFIRQFSMPVDMEGTELMANTVETEPAQPSPGNDYVKTGFEITNTGNKPVEEIVIEPMTPENIQPAYSEDEKFYVGRLNPGDSRSLNLGLDLDEDLRHGKHDIFLETSYEDTDSNDYNKTLSIPLRVEGRPDLELVNNSDVEMKAGGKKKISLFVRNTGSQDAEGVTARMIAERSQPIRLEDRSDYVGQIESGDTAEAVMTVSSDRNADLKTHNMKVQLTASGDSSESDRSSYSFTEIKQISFVKRTISPLIYVGGVASLFVALIIGYRFKGRETK